MSSPIILHCFEASPFAEKIRLIFGLKSVKWQFVDAEVIMPKPFLTSLTGGYRKTPVMQIGSDIYCDSRLIALELEERFPTPSLFSEGTRATTLALTSWSDRDLHYSTSGLAIGMNKNRFPPELMKDRKEYFGSFLDIDVIDKQVPHLLTQLLAHFAIIEEQLSDGRMFWFGEKPGLADFQSYCHVWTAYNHIPSANIYFEKFQRLVKWMERVKAIGHGEKGKMTREEAQKVAEEGKVVKAKGVEPNVAFGMKEGDFVQVTPTDYGCIPVSGRLVTLNSREIAISRQQNDVTLIVHFPRIGYCVKSVTEN